MSDKYKKMIDVINYHNFGIAIKTRDNSYWIDAMKDGVPTMLPLKLDEIKYINTTSEAFKAGLLFFNEDIEKDLYEQELRIHDWKSILKPSEIKDIILNPTVEGLERIIGVRSILVFDIIRGIFVDLKNNENADISTRVERIINTRYKELLNKVYNTQIVIRAKDTIKNTTSKDVDKLKAQNEAMQSELAEMKKMLSEMIDKQKSTINAKKDKDETDNKAVQSSKKKTTKTAKSNIKSTTKKTENKTTKKK